MTAVPIVLALIAIGLAVRALQLARKAEQRLTDSIDAVEEGVRRRAHLSHAADMVDARRVKPEGLRTPLLTDDEAARAVADWNAKKAEALTREINDAAIRTPWVRRARPMTTDEADAWVAARTAQLRHDLGEQP